MSQRASIWFRSPLGLLCFLLSFGVPAAALADARVSESYGKLPLHFEANRGQTHQDVHFLSRGPGYALYLTGGEAVLVLTRPALKEARDAHDTQAPQESEAVALRMALVGAHRKPLVSGLEELPGKANYFVGNDPAKWRANVPTYAKVRYDEVYPGIDLIYYGNQRQLEYDFVVAPGADPRKIVLAFKGADKLEIDTQGDLVLHMGGSVIRQHKPVIYQEIDGVRQEIAGSYVRKGRNRVGFKVAAYDTSRPLIIDPVVLAYSTYLGGSVEERPQGIAVDAGGNAYITGSTGTGFPTTAGAFQTVTGGSTEVFVTKLDPSGSALVYSTFLGGGGGDSSSAIAVDAGGNAYVTGNSSSADFPTTAGAFKTTGPGSFVAKLNPAGSALVYSTFIGAALSSGIALDTDGNAYLTGMAHPDYPITPGAFQVIYGGTDSMFGEADAFVTKLNSTGSALVYSTFLGGDRGDMGAAIAVDFAGNAYVTGYTRSANFPTTLGAFQPVQPVQQPFGTGGLDAFVTKLDPTGSFLVYSTFLGGTVADRAHGIAVDADGNAYVGGSSGSPNFPTTPDAFRPVSPSGGGFVTKLHPTGSLLVYSTFLGGGVLAIAADATGRAHVTGAVGLDNMPTTPDAFQSSNAGGTDAFVTILNPAGSALDYSTYLGGPGEDFGSAIAVDTNGNAYVTGRVHDNFPTTPGAFQTTFGGPFDAFVAKFSTATAPTRSEESAGTYTNHWPSYGAEMGTFSGGTSVASNQATATATFSFTGTAVTWIGVRCNVCGIATVSIDGGTPITVNTFGPGAPGSLTSEPVFSASGLAPDVTHTLVITVTGTGAAVPNSLIGGNSHVAVDAFDVTR